MNQQRRCKGVKLDNKKCTRKCDGKYCWQHMQTGCGKGKESKTNQIGCARGKESKTNQIGCARGKGKESNRIQTQHRKTQTGGGDDDMNKLSCFTTGKTKVCMETDTMYYCSTDNKKDAKFDYYRCSENDGSCNLIENDDKIENSYRCKKIEKLPGLKWTSNNCYFNSGIKMLLSISPLIKYIMKNRKKLLESKESATRNFVRIINSVYVDILQGHIDTLVLDQQQICKMIKPSMNWGAQNDPMELFEGIFDDFEETMKPDLYINKLIGIEWINFDDKEKHKIVRIGLDESAKENITMEELLNNFFAFYHSIVLPQYLLVHIERIHQISGANQQLQQEKIKTKIDYRNDIKLMDNKYKLEGVIYHSGSAQGGHYTCRAKFGGKWWDHNDNDVTEIPRDAVNDTTGVYQEKIKRNDKNAPLSHAFLYRKL
jgi:ubiquitin C-terminal hydrolase